MIVIWTIYDRPIAAFLGERPSWGWTARRSIPGEPVEAGEHLMHSSDIDALRDQLKKMGFSRYGRDPEDDESIIEVWLKRHNRPTTEKRVAA